MTPRDSVNQKFSLLERLVYTACLPGSGIKSLVISGSPGIGKTYAVNTIVPKAAEELGLQVVPHKGKTTGFQLYESLARYPGKEFIHVFDDCDTVFNTQDALNVLKAACDRESNYIVSWESLRASVPQIRFMGKLIILTNYRLSHSVHYKALLDRITYAPLELTDDELNYRLLQLVAYKSEQYQLAPELVSSVLEWLFENRHLLRTGFTVRTMEKALTLVQEYGDDWPLFAEFTLLFTTQEFYTADVVSK